MNIQNLIKLGREKINFSPDSVMDDFGRVFFYEGRVFRAINNSNKKNCLELMNSDLFDELIQGQFIPRTWISGFQLEDCELVLEHERLYESRVHHWSFTMLKDAALFVLNLNRICNQYGYELKDAHPFNIFFQHNKPIFIDLGSICKSKGSSKWKTSAYEEFISCYFIPLLLWNNSEFFLARRLIEDSIYPMLRTIPMKRILDSQFVEVLGKDIFDFKFYYRSKLLYSSTKKNSLFHYGAKLVNKAGGFILNKRITPFSYVKVIKESWNVERKIKNLSRPLDNTLWTSYHDAFKIGKDIVSTPRFDRIIQLVSEIAPDSKTVLDLAGNQGAFCYLLSRHLSLDRIILTDYDGNAIDKAYCTFKSYHINIETYMFNFLQPLEREEKIFFKSDIVFALAITHHLTLTQGYILSVIFDEISSFSNKYVVIEFMPLGLWSGGAIPEIPRWYNVDWFRNEFRRYFHVLIEEKLEENRIVFFGKKYESC